MGLIGKLHFGLMMCSLVSFGFADTSDQVASLTLHQKNGTSQTFYAPAADGIKVFSSPTGITSTGSVSGRYLVRLKDQPLQPMIKKLKGQQLLGFSDPNNLKQQIRTLAVSQKLRIQQAQSSLITDLNRRKVQFKVHRQFHQLTNTISLNVAGADLAALRTLPQVAAVYPDSQVKASLAESVPATHAPKVWDLKDATGIAITGKGIKVAILDTGIDYTQPDLGGCLGKGCKVVAGQNFVEGEAADNLMDHNGHGTHVAGIVAASGVLKGLAPDASLYAYKVLNNDGFGTDSSIIAGLEKAVNPDGDAATDDGADVINMSLGGPADADSPLSEAANAAMASGAVVVVAAGNSGSRYGTIGSPGNAARVLTVGAADNTGAIAYFSSRGPVKGKNYVKPELLAPGMNINSVKAGGGYTVLSGTSMASPHVAGGAALMMQAHPELSPDDIKSLLITSAHDQGLDIFTQGAGFMDLEAAINTKLLLSFPLVFAGRVDVVAPTWQSISTVKLKNISKQNVDVSLLPPDKSIAGFTLGLPIGFAKSLQPGEEAQVDVTASVDNQLLAFSELATLHHENKFTLKAGDTNIRVPVALIKAAQLRVDAGTKVEYIVVFSGENKFSDTRFYGCADSATTNSYDLKPGAYNVVVSYCGSAPAIVFKETVAVNKSDSVKVDSSEAIYKLAVDKIIKEDSSELNSSQLSASLSSLSWYHAGAQTLLFSSYGGGTSTLLKTSPFSSAFKMRGGFLLQEQGVTNDKVKKYYMHNFFHDSLSQDDNASLKLSELHKLDFLYDDQLMIKKGINFSVELGQIYSLASGAAFGFRYFNAIPQYTAAEASIYSSLSTFDAGEIYPNIYIGAIDNSGAWPDNVTFMRTGYIGFPTKDQYVKFKGPFSRWEDGLFLSSDNKLVVEDSSLFWSSYFVYNSFLKTMAALDADNFFSVGGVERDSAQNVFLQNVDYSSRCDNEIVSEGKIYDADFLTKLAGKTCALRSYEIHMPTRFLNKEYSSTIRFNLNTQEDPLNYSYDLSTPILEQLAFIDNDVYSRVLKSANPRIKIIARDKQAGKMALTLAAAIKLEYKLDNMDAWQALKTSDEKNEVVAKLPLVEGAHLGSLRITITDARGSNVEQTLNSAFMLGTGSERPPTFPEFNALPVLTVEATGALTPYELPSVTADDRRDGPIKAVSNLQGPFALGTYKILWSATNKAGNTTTAAQTLVVKDTTPPLVTAPNAIQVQAKKAGDTVIDLGLAQAIDLVDGTLKASPSFTGPFAVGTYIIRWEAIDASGNVGSATQSVVVTAPPESSSASSANSSVVSTPGASNTNSGSSSGGGGAIDYINLFYLLVLSIFVRAGRKSLRV